MLNTCLLTRAGAEKGVVSVDLSESILGGRAGGPGQAESGVSVGGVQRQRLEGEWEGKQVELRLWKATEDLMREEIRSFIGS